MNLPEQKHLLIKHNNHNGNIYTGDIVEWWDLLEIKEGNKT